MTEICYSAGAGSFTLEARGHADYAPRGRDIVCAAVSSLIWALKAYVERMYGAGELIGRPLLEAENGRALICARPRREAAEKIRGAFELTKAGFSLLAGNYPGNVRLINKICREKRQESEQNPHELS
ncbi:MAG: ribosomal-processing cysteine protease Prp [Candidatus Limivicinus sp.]|jgi:uncharacterized protein YsxB (DUF464 family)